MKNKTTFSEQVKYEITTLQYDDNCLKALLSSFIQNRRTVVITHNELVWRLNSQFPFIIEFIAKSLKSLYDVRIETHISNTATNINGETNYIEIIGNFDLIERDLMLSSLDPVELVSNLDSKKAYIAGAFLVGGSVNSLGAKYYHLEIRSDNYKYLQFLQNMLIAFKIFPVLTKHTKKQFILYLKKADQISDFLKLINATNCMFAFEDHKISKDMNSNITRLNNLDVSNINKSTVTGYKQVNWINAIKDSTIYKKQSRKFKCFCELRLANQESSLSELVELMLTNYRIKTTKPGLNHLARKLEKLFKENGEKK